MSSTAGAEKFVARKRVNTLARWIYKRLLELEIG
jgi:hypothetical protein